MKEQTIPDTPGRRAAAYWFIDGLPEIVAGIGLVAVGGSLLWFHQIHPHSWPVSAAFLVIGLLSFFLVFDYDRAFSMFRKSHVTFPRTGYVRPPAEAPQRETVISLGLVGEPHAPDQNITQFRSLTVGVVFLGNIVAGVIAKPIGVPIAMSAVALLLYAVHRGSERPYHWASVLPLPAAGIAAMYLHMGQDDNAWVAVFIGGVWLLAQGAWRLLAYVRQHPKYEPVESLRP